MARRIPTVTVTETYKVPDFTARIKRGVALLDQRAPGWALKVDLKALDLGSTSKCIVGQLAIKEMLNGPLEGYYEGIQKLWPKGDEDEKARQHGFVLDDEDYGAVEQMLLKEPSYHPWKMSGEDNGYRDDYISGVLYEFLSHQWFQVVKARQAAASRRAAKKTAAKKTTAKKTMAKKTVKKAVAKKVTPKKVAR